MRVTVHSSKFYFEALASVEFGDTVRQLAGQAMSGPIQLPKHLRFLYFWPFPKVL